MKCFYCKREGIQNVMQDGRKVMLCQYHLDDFLDEELEAKEENDKWND